MNQSSEQSARCEVRNGSYGCSKAKDHDGPHAGRILTSRHGVRRRRSYTFTDSYAPVRFES